MSQPNTPAQLAAEMVPCPDCAGTGEVRNKQKPLGAVWPLVSCPGCNGSGTVPLFPGLRVPCLIGRGDMRDLHYDEAGERHLARACPGYSVLSEAEALLVLLEWACEHWKDHHGIQADVDFTYYKKAAQRIWVATICCGHASFPDGIEGEGESPQDALAAALLAGQAVAKEKLTQRERELHDSEERERRLAAELTRLLDVVGEEDAQIMKTVLEELKEVPHAD